MARARSRPAQRARRVEARSPATLVECSDRSPVQSRLDIEPRPEVCDDYPADRNRAGPASAIWISRRVIGPRRNDIAHLGWSKTTPLLPCAFLVTNHRGASRLIVSESASAL